MIEFQGVSKLYGKVIGVNDINLSLGPGAYGLLGPNGSGKTTWINLIIGHLRPTLGTVRVFGRDPWNRGDLLRRIGVCPALEIQLPGVTAFEWVAHLVTLHGFSRADARQRAAKSLELVGMTPAMHRAITTYSLGMRQRTKLAQAIAHDPEILVLDEPFNGLDPIARFEMIEYLKEFVASGKSLILASHVLHEVEAVNPSLLLISGGRLLASGSSSEIRTLLTDCPTTIFIRTTDPRRLAKHVTEIDSAERIEIDSENGGLLVSTRSSSALLENLPRMSTAAGVQISEVRPSNESLGDIFADLMKVHRGEA